MTGRPSGLLAAAVAVRDAEQERAAQAKAVRDYGKPRLCSECLKPLEQHVGAGRPKKRCGARLCHASWLKRRRTGWREPEGASPWPRAPHVSTEVIAARAVYDAAVEQARVAKLRLRAAIAAVKDRAEAA